MTTGVPSVGARLVGDDLGHLPLLQPLVVAALDMGVVEDDAPGARLEREATAAARLNRIDGPAPAILGLERQARGIVNDEPAEDRLAGERRGATASFAKLLELTRRHPVHVERGREIARDVPVSAPPAPLVHLLKQQNVGFESAKHVEDRVVGLPAFDVPRHDTECLVGRDGVIDAGRFTRQPVDSLVTQPRIAHEPEYTQPRETQHKAELSHRLCRPLRIEGADAGERAANNNTVAQRRGKKLRVYKVLRVLRGSTGLLPVLQVPVLHVEPHRTS